MCAVSFRTEACSYASMSLRRYTTRPPILRYLGPVPMYRQRSRVRGLTRHRRARSAWCRCMIVITYSHDTVAFTARNRGTALIPDKVKSKRVYFAKGCGVDGPKRTAASEAEEVPDEYRMLELTSSRARRLLWEEPASPSFRDEVIAGDHQQRVLRMPTAFSPRGS